MTFLFETTTNILLGLSSDNVRLTSREKMSQVQRLEYCTPAFHRSCNNIMISNGSIGSFQRMESGGSVRRGANHSNTFHLKNLKVSNAALSRIKAGC